MAQLNISSPPPKDSPDFDGWLIQVSQYLNDYLGYSYTQGNKTISVSKTISENIVMSYGSMFTIPNGITLTITGRFEAGLYQVFNCTGTGKVVFGALSVTEIHPEWWGKCPNGTNDTAVLNKAIAATVVWGDVYGRVGDPSLVLGPGKYYVEPGNLSPITCTLLAHEAIFSPTEEVTAGLSILQFSYLEGLQPKQVRLGGVIGLTAYNADPTTHYHIGVNLIKGDHAQWEIGQLSNLKVGLSVSGDSSQEHVGIHKFKIGVISGCETGIFLSCGTGDNTTECNVFDIDYVTWNATAVYLYGVTGDSYILNNTFNINVLELNALSAYVVYGFLVSGPVVFSNMFRVRGGLVPPGAGSASSYIIVTSDSCYDNTFELCYLDIAKCYFAGGYNIIRQDGIANATYPSLLTNDNARSTIMDSAAPTAGIWRRGDKCWNSTPTAAQYIGFICVASGTPGTWKGFGLIEA